MGKKLFVGGLPFATSSSELEELFGQVGQVESATVITDRNTGRSRGFGFVEMSSDDEAAKAIEKLNGNDVGGRNIVVAEAKPREEQPEREEPKE
ncbi:MAG: RNA-binding protein [Candidatus Woykebacteria bacterium GWB1_45_5]|uniref:RNA-binding protein n=2 Tax=Candidatus Woykeibacteriota TaxID=1817899 RepID=A0A1G1W2N8_9BACT|nr:MAG: RNA-binding protein [Candidatus Woykebacteria bacterium GWA1_44_8]OGY23982.1 MAG: RNA-binding protein [Candidatus Woykebacteria bacterium GWB1_45_5]